MFRVACIQLKSNNNILHNLKKTEKFNFSKLSQKVFISEKKVTKFFSDKNIVKKLYLKTKFNHKLFPNKVHFKRNFLSCTRWNCCWHWNKFKKKL